MVSTLCVHKVKSSISDVSFAVSAKSANKEAMRVLMQTRKKLEGTVGATQLGVEGHVNYLIQVSLPPVCSFQSVCHVCCL